MRVKSALRQLCNKFSTNIRKDPGAADAGFAGFGSLALAARRRNRSKSSCLGVAEADFDR
jgi:hypothetical protein